ncbi:MAG: SIR2 family NAD-dependent protein deacylase [Alkalispirochaetaceae bacterium]
MKRDLFEEAARRISEADSLIAFTGAGVSVESGVPTFRGEGGVWERWDPEVLDINYFYAHPRESWRAIREIFYAGFLAAEPNAAHKTLAFWEEIGLLKGIITQNIDGLHERAGSRRIVEYHGNSNYLICTQTGRRYPVTEQLIEPDIPVSEVEALLKPDFTFFGEGVPPEAAREAEQLSREADVMIVIGTTGEVYPAALLPRRAKENGATLIEINTEQSAYTPTMTDIYLRGKASEILPRLNELLP